MTYRIGHYRVLGILAALVLMCSAPAFAQEVFSYTGSVVGAGAPVVNGSNSTYSVTAGASYQLEVFLQSSASPSASILATGAEAGLYGGGAQVSLASGTGSISTTSGSIVFDSTDFAPGYSLVNGAYASSAQISATSDSFSETLDPTANSATGVEFNAPGAPVGTAANQIYLATLTLIAPTSGSSVFHIGAEPGGNITITYNNGEDLDTGATNGGPSYEFTPAGGSVESITLSATPEPSTLGLLTIAGLFALKRRRPLQAIQSGLRS